MAVTDAADLKVLVTGSRYLTDRKLVRRVLSERWMHTRGLMTLIHGANPAGADHYAQRWFEDMMREGGVEEKLEVIPCPAKNFGSWPACGPRRNAYMVQILQPDICFGFFKHGAENKGTTDCVTKALDAGIPIRTFWSE